MAWTTNSGVYSITNIITGDSYIGSSQNINKRFITHKSLLNSNNHYNKHLQSSYNKYGKENFIFRFILICNICNLVLYEQACIDNFKPTFNKRIVEVESNRGIKRSDEFKEKLRIMKIGKKRSELSKIVQSLAQRGKRKVGKTYNESLIGPDGSIYSNINNVRKFCAEHNIPNPKPIYALLTKTNPSGHHGFKSYKGWKLCGL